MDDFGSVIIVLHFPEEWNFGIDMTMWKVGPKFKGIRGVPRGIHFVYYSSPNEEWRAGNFHFFDKDEELVIYKWDKNTESLIRHIELEQNQDAVLNLINDVTIISSLAPYNQVVDEEQVSDWLAISNHISKEVVDRIQPVQQGPFMSSEEGAGNKGDSSTIFWSAIPELLVPRDISPRSLSRLHMDTSTRLHELLKSTKDTSSKNICAELQASFVVFLLGQNYESFVQWKQLTLLFLGCGESFIRRDIEIFSQFIRVLTSHVHHIPLELLSEEDLSDPLFDNTRKPFRQIFLLPMIVDFLDECSDIVELQPEMAKLEKTLTAKFHSTDWMSGAISNEDGPVIVDM
jgi:A1 cistron-splicing factor AAR2